MRAQLAVPFLALSLLAPLSAKADNFPYVQDGPAIVGVSDTDAWVTWYTAHHEGTGTECTAEEIIPGLGDHNTDIPTLTLDTPGGAVQFQNANCDRYHTIHLTGLTASTAYTFTLDKPWDAIGGTTAAGSFTTAPAPGTAGQIKFVVYGDTRNDIALGGTDTEPDHQAVVNAILANESDSAFLIHTGDMALEYHGHIRRRQGLHRVLQRRASPARQISGLRGAGKSRDHRHHLLRCDDGPRAL